MRLPPSILGPRLGRERTTPRPQRALFGTELHIGTITEAERAGRKVVTLNARQAAFCLQLDGLKERGEYRQLITLLERNLLQNDEARLPSVIADQIFSELILQAIDNSNQEIEIACLLWLYRRGEEGKDGICYHRLVGLLKDRTVREALPSWIKERLFAHAFDDKQPRSNREKYVACLILQVFSPEGSALYRVRLIEELWDGSQNEDVETRREYALLGSEVALGIWYALPEIIDQTKLADMHSYLILHDEELRSLDSDGAFHSELFHRLHIFGFTSLAEVLLRVWGVDAQNPFAVYHQAMLRAYRPGQEAAQATEAMHALKLEDLVYSRFFPAELDTGMACLLVRIRGQVAQSAYQFDKAAASKIAGFVPVGGLREISLGAVPGLEKILGEARRKAMAKIERDVCQEDLPFFVFCNISDLSSAVLPIRSQAEIFFYLGEKQVELYFDLTPEAAGSRTYLRVCFRIIREGEKRHIDPTPIFDPEQIAGDPPAWLVIYTTIILQACIDGYGEQDIGASKKGVDRLVSAILASIRKSRAGKKADRPVKKTTPPCASFVPPPPSQRRALPPPKIPVAQAQSAPRVFDLEGFWKALEFDGLRRHQGNRAALEARQAALNAAADLYREFLGPFESFRANLIDPLDLPVRPVVQAILDGMGIEKITLAAKDTAVEVVFHLPNGRGTFTTVLQDGWQLAIPATHNRHPAFARSLLIATVLEGCMLRQDARLVGAGEIERALKAEPDRAVQVKPAGKPVPASTAKEPAVSIGPAKGVEPEEPPAPIDPAPPAKVNPPAEPSTEGIPVTEDPVITREKEFFARAQRHLTALRQRVVELGIDLTSPTVLEDAAELAAFLLKYRDNDLEASKRLSLTERGDSLGGIFSDIEVFTTDSAASRLTDRGLQAETVAALNLGIERVLVCFKNDNPRTRIYGVLDLAKGEIELLGASDGMVGDDLRARLLRIGLESYGVCTSQTIMLLRKLLRLGAGEARQVLIDRWVAARKGTKNLPPATRAIAIMDADSQGIIGGIVKAKQPNYGQLLPRLRARARDLTIAERGLDANEPIYLKDRWGHYALVAGPGRQRVIKTTAFSKIFLLDRRAVVSTLPLMRRKVGADGTRELLPKLPDGAKVIEARRLGLDIQPRAGIFAVVEYDHNPDNIIVVRLAQEVADDLPPVRIREIDYPARLLEGIQLDVYPGMPEEVVAKLLLSPEAVNLMASWSAQLEKGIIPDERKRISNGRAEAFADLEPTACRLLVMPVPRTFIDPEFIPLSSLSISAQQAIRQQNSV